MIAQVPPVSRETVKISSGNSGRRRKFREFLLAAWRKRTTGRSFPLKGFLCQAHALNGSRDPSAETEASGANSFANQPAIKRFSLAWTRRRVSPLATVTSRRVPASRPSTGASAAPSPFRFARFLNFNIFGRAASVNYRLLGLTNIWRLFADRAREKPKEVSRFEILI